QKEYTPSFGDGPSAESKITPIEVSSCASEKALSNSEVVFGRKAFLTSGLLKAIRATPPHFLYVMSSNSMAVCQLIVSIYFLISICVNIRQYLHFENAPF